MLAKLFTENAVRAIMLSVVAGFSTMLGAFGIFSANGRSKKVVTFSLGFAAGVLISVSFTELLPSAQELTANYTGKRIGVLLTIFCLIAGMLVSYAIDRLIPHQKSDESGDMVHANLFRTGVVSTLAIAMHNLPEGIATFMAGYKDAALGVSIAVAISLHNIPEGISVSIPIYAATGSKKRALYYTFLSGVAEPAGAILAFLILRPIINDLFLGIVFSLISGIMLYVAIEEMIPSSRQYGHTRLALFSSFAGICLMPLTNVIM